MSAHVPPDRPPRRADQPTGDLHELAHVERLLRADERANQPVVDVGPGGARVSFRTAPFNSHTRGSITATVVNEIAHTSAWGVSTIHDPHETDVGTTSMLTVVYLPDKEVR